MTEPLVIEPGISCRRYLLLKFHAAMEMEQYALAGVWRAQLEEQAGSTPLPAGFPFLSLLQQRAYTSWEDLDGATADELGRNLELGPMDAQAILNAWKVLPTPDA